MPVDPFLRSVEDSFRRHGIPAVLDPDGVAREVMLLPARPDGIAEFGDMRIQSETGLFEILAVAFAGHGKGAILALVGERRRVQHARVRDPRRYKTQLDTIAV